MSVLVLDQKCFEQVAHKLHFLAAASYPAKLNVADEMGFDSEKKAISFCNDLLHLNELSFECRYEKKKIKLIRKEAFTKLPVSNKAISNEQCLLFLQSISYNIELDTIFTTCNEVPARYKQAATAKYKQLKELINALALLIVAQLPSYTSANWSTAGIEY